MKKTSAIFLFAVFAAGCLLGYLDLFTSWMPGGKSPSEKEAHATGRAPASMMVRRGGSGNQSLPTEQTLTGFLVKYAEFSPQEIRAELDRLRKQQKELKKYNYALEQAISYLAYKLGGLSPEEAKRLLEDKSNPENKSLYSELLDGWAETDFEGAMSYFLAHKNDFERSHELFKTMTDHLVSKDPDKAVKWLSSLTPGERSVALACMAEVLPKQHPGKVPEFMAALTQRELSSIGSELVENWSASDWDSFKLWADTLKGEKQREVLFRAISQLASVDLDKATEEFKKMDSKNRDKMGRVILEGIDDDDKSSGKALDWVIENRESFSDFLSLMREAMSTWNGYSQLAAKTLQLPEGEIRDAALSGLLESQSSISRSGDYEENINNKFTGLLELAEKIGDSHKREASVLDCAEGWLRKSPEKARQWIVEKSAFSPQVKQELLEKYDRWQKEKESEYF